jgi:hypothetical protein
MQREQLIPHVASTIDSYMKEHNVSIEVAREQIHKLKEESWKDFNSEWLNLDNSYPKPLLERIFNLTRTIHVQSRGQFHKLLQPKGYYPFIIDRTISHSSLVFCHWQPANKLLWYSIVWRFFLHKLLATRIVNVPLCVYMTTYSFTIFLISLFTHCHKLQSEIQEKFKACPII